MNPFVAIPFASVEYAFSQSDMVGRAIVVLLFILSMYAWIIMCDKGASLQKGRRNSRSFLRLFQQALSPLELYFQSSKLACPVVAVYRAGIREVMDVLEVDPQLVEEYCRRRSLPRSLTEHEVDKVRSTMERTVAGEIERLETRLGWLGTIVTISPFLGLLGTVWGVMIAFCGMAQVGRPDISAIAPGVSGALLTTVVGLFVAIPSVIGYNSITNAVRKSTVEMDNFVEDFLALLKLRTEAR